MLKSDLLESLEWLEHGFGTRGETGPGGDCATLKQIHSAASLAVFSAGCAGEADALMTDRAGLALAVRTADCYPIVLADPRRRAAAIAHAGWRGTAARIAAETIRKMRAEFGTDPEDIFAAIGPGIAMCCYDVGEDVARRFGMEGARELDLAAANRAQLLESGVAAERIDVLGLCTFCNPEQFESYRRDKERAGRMISYARIA